MVVPFTQAVAAAPHEMTSDLAPQGSSILDLFAEWQDIREACCASTTEAEGLRLHGAYVQLQRRITALRPITAREMAIQFYVETDDGESEYRPEFFSRIRHLAEGV